MPAGFVKPPAKLYEFHVANLRSVTAALDRFARAGREALARGRDRELLSFTRGFALLLGVEAEVRLSKMLYEPRAFTDLECESIQGKQTQLERWYASIECAFRKHYSVPKALLSDKTVPHDAFHRYSSLRVVLEKDLAPIITARNKLAHGQWVYPLNDAADDVVPDLYKALNDEKLLGLELKRHLIKHLAAAVHDLVVSKPTFERDFEEHYRAFAQASIRLSRIDYVAWEKRLRDKAERGRVRWRSNRRVLPTSGVW
jgi:hypothetical protein